jgi:hypothetical protein
LCAELTKAWFYKRETRHAYRERLGLLRQGGYE